MQMEVSPRLRAARWAFLLCSANSSTTICPVTHKTQVRLKSYILPATGVSAQSGPLALSAPLGEFVTLQVLPFFFLQVYVTRTQNFIGRAKYIFSGRAPVRHPQLLPTQSPILGFPAPPRFFQLCNEGKSHTTRLRSTSASRFGGQVSHPTHSQCLRS